MFRKLIVFFFPLLVFGQAMKPPFDYDLRVSSIEGTAERTLICFHGYGANFEIASTLKALECVDSTLVSFNFPEHDIEKREYDPQKATFGTLDELLPALYVMKQVVLDGGLKAVDLYGFSAGGGALINAIGILNTSFYDAELQKIGIGPKEKKELLAAIQKGVIILDTPLKSMEEIIALRGSSEEFEILAKNYRDNHLRPIDGLKRLEGLSLDILLHFQQTDEILSNRDDALYIEQLKMYQKNGRVRVVIGDDGGHMLPHWSLWHAYAAKMAVEKVSFLDTSEGKIAYVDSGGEGFAVVFLHGNSCSLKVFQKQLDHFAPEYRVVAIDLPGHGKSDAALHPEVAYTIPGYARLMDEVIQKLGLKEFAVVGFSLGGNIALQWSQCSNSLRGIMLLSSAPMKYSKEAYTAYPPYPGNQGGNPDRLTEVQATEFMQGAGFNTNLPSLRFVVEDTMRAEGKARTTMVTSVLAGKGVDETKIVAELPIPLAVVAGEKDPALGLVYMAELPYRNLWHDQVHLIPSGGHAIVYHQADAVNDLLEAFLSEVKP